MHLIAMVVIFVEVVEVDLEIPIEPMFKLHILGSVNMRFQPNKMQRHCYIVAT